MFGRTRSRYRTLGASQALERSRAREAQPCRAAGHLRREHRHRLERGPTRVSRCRPCRCGASHRFSRISAHRLSSPWRAAGGRSACRTPSSTSSIAARRTPRPERRAIRQRLPDDRAPPDRRCVRGPIRRPRRGGPRPPGLSSADHRWDPRPRRSGDRATHVGRVHRVVAHHARPRHSAWGVDQPPAYRVSVMTIIRRGCSNGRRSCVAIPPAVHRRPRRCENHNGRWTRFPFFQTLRPLWAGDRGWLSARPGRVEACRIG